MLRRRITPLTNSGTNENKFTNHVPDTAINFNASPYRISTHSATELPNKQNKQRQEKYIRRQSDLIILIFFHIYTYT